MRCYNCGKPLEPVPSGYQGPLLPQHATRDHVPPKGIFNDPKPSNLITVDSCNECNLDHSGFDERLRAFAAIDINRNEGGQKILQDKVFGSTMRKRRQRKFMRELALSLRPEVVTTPAGPQLLDRGRVDGREFHKGSEAMTKGLLRHLYPDFDYYSDSFATEAVNSARLATGVSHVLRLLISGVTEGSQGEIIGNFEEFRFWHRLELQSHRGFWFLLFYASMGFVVSHSRDPSLPQAVSVV